VTPPTVPPTSGRNPRRSARALVIGPMPPPVHGYSMVTAFIAEKLGEITALEIVNTAADSMVRDGRYHARRLTRAARALWHVLRGRPASRSLYVAIAGGAGVFYDLPLILAARLLRYRLYIHHHSFSYINRRNFWTALLLAIAGTAATHICLSARMAARLTALYPGVGPTPVLSNAMLVPPVEIRAARSGPIRLGYLSNLIPEKGVDTAIAVTRALRALKRDVVLSVAGPALDAVMQALITHTQDELGSGFEYRGAVYGPDKAAFFRDIDIFLFPTRYANEAQPLVVLEALAAGIPVLATDRGSIAEDVGDCGAVLTDAAFIGEAVRLIGGWCADRNRIAELSAATLRQARAAHAAAKAQLGAMLSAIAAG